MVKVFRRMKKKRIISIAAYTSITVGFAIILIGMSFYKYQISKLGITETMDYQSYKYHYAMITQEGDEPFWNEIYQSALEKGKEQEVYVEKIGSGLSVSYSLYDLMEIAIASKVDGIILEPNGEENITELINKADEMNIPVVTVMKDDPLSNRISFVGISSYNQGRALGQQVMEVIANGRNKITVLLHYGNHDTNQNVIYSGIRETVAEKNVELEAATINAKSTFGSEEDIRNIIMDNVDPPEVMVCLTAADTLSAYQAVVDYNKVGEIDIIGYYDSELILSAINKKIVHSTLAIDANQMGIYCVEALTEYKETNRVSDYFLVDISVINDQNVSDYMKDKHTGDNEE